MSVPILKSGLIREVAFNESVLIIEGLLYKKTVYPLFQKTISNCNRKILNSHKKYNNKKKHVTTQCIVIIKFKIYTRYSAVCNRQNLLQKK